MATKPTRRRALDHLPARPAAAAAAPRFSERAVEIYRGGRDDWTVFPYDKLIWMNYQPGKGIQIHFASHLVFIAGHKLTSLYEQIRDQYAKSIGPEDGPQGPCTPGVESVYIKQVGKSEPGFVWPEEATLRNEQA